MLTPQAQKRLLDELAEKPLKPAEIRRIVGMGALYVSLQKQPDSLFSLEIGGVPHHFHRAFSD